MNPVATIRHRVCLVLRMIDTTTGTAVTGGPPAVLRNGKPVRPIDKGGGYLLFLGEEPEDYRLTVRVQGYEEREITVFPGELNPVEPLLEFALVPDGGQTCRTLEGVLTGVDAVDAVRAGDSSCLIREFDARRRVMRIFNPHRLELSGIHYAVVDPGAGSYERFVIRRRLSDTELEIDRVLQRPFDTHFPVVRVVNGLCRPDGRWLLRVRDDRSKNSWFVRLQAAEEERFYRVEMNAPLVALPPEPARGGG